MSRALCTLRVSNQNTNWYSIKQLSQHTELVTTSTSYKWIFLERFKSNNPVNMSRKLRHCRRLVARDDISPRQSCKPYVTCILA